MNTSSLVKTVYIIVGPTAVGKTAFAIELAKKLNTEIISADARQCFKELNIGVARPSKAELEQVTHHFIASHSIHDEMNAAIFEQYALQKAEMLFRTKDAIVMVGGTGLYIKAFCEGMDLIPEIDPAIRVNIMEQYNLKGLGWLRQIVAEKDPAYWAQGIKQANGELENPQRLMRALEVVLGTGTSILSYQRNTKLERPFKIIKIGLEMPRPFLYERINQRVLNMIQEGLEQEVRSLFYQFHLNALQTVGYSEWESYIKDEISLSRVIELIQQNTRHYAKRQMTWFKKDPSIQWQEASTVKADHIIQ